MKKILTAILFSMVSALIFAIPGTDHFIQDQSGEFVYYRDYSFRRESYIGFLIYDEGTFAARYFAPAQEDAPVKVIELLFTIDTTADHMAMTGERFLTPLLPEDTELVNYIHDLIYEFGSRRKKAGEISPLVKNDSKRNPSVEYVPSTMLINSGFRIRDEFEQFGGDVFVYYDYLVPIFNLKKIVSNSGENVLEIVATGKIVSAEDRSFSDFKIISPAEKTKTHRQSKAKTKTAETEKTVLTLDENWTNAGNLENMFFYGNTAVLRTGLFSTEDYYLYLKTCLISSQNAYLPWNKISVLEDKDKLIIHTAKYTGKNNYHTISSILTKNAQLSDNENAMLSLTVSEADYDESRKYFQNIVKSWH